MYLGLQYLHDYCLSCNCYKRNSQGKGKKIQYLYSGILNVICSMALKCYMFHCIGKSTCFPFSFSMPCIVVTIHVSSFLCTCLIVVMLWSSRIDNRERVKPCNFVALVAYFIAKRTFGLVCYLLVVCVYVCESSWLRRCNCPEPKKQSINGIMFLMLFLDEQIKLYVGILSILILLLLLLEMPLKFH